MAGALPEDIAQYACLQGGDGDLVPGRNLAGQVLRSNIMAGRMVGMIRKIRHDHHPWQTANAGSSCEAVRLQWRNSVLLIGASYRAAVGAAGLTGYI